MNSVINLVGSNDIDDNEEEIVAEVHKMTDQRLNGHFQPIYDPEYWKLGDEIDTDYSHLSPPFDIDPRLKRFSSVAFDGIPCRFESQDVLEDLYGLHHIYLHSTIRRDSDSSAPRIYHCMIKWKFIKDLMQQFILPYGHEYF